MTMTVLILLLLYNISPDSAKRNSQCTAQSALHENTNGQYPEDDLILVPYVVDPPQEEA